MPMTFARRAADGGLGMTANRTERETPQGPATSFVVACAFAPVAGALGYKLRPEGRRSKDPPFGKGGAPAKARKSRSLARLC